MNREISTCGGPYFDELERGQYFDNAPALTLTPGIAAMHRAIIGDRMRLALDEGLSVRVTQEHAQTVSPALTWDVAIGQSTLATQRVKANLFYRGLAFHRFPVMGDTLFTRTEVVSLRENSRRPGRKPTGMAVLRVITRDQQDRRVLDFYRCAMLPISPDAVEIGRQDDWSETAVAPIRDDPTRNWDAQAFRARVGGPHFATSLEGAVLRSTGDVVSSAPELARLTLNIAAVHHDSRAGGQRLVYGGHTIGLALAQATRLLPNLATVLSWRSCDHTGPVYEGDTLYSVLSIESATALPEERGGTLDLRSLVYAEDPDARADRKVLDWRFTGLMF
ncbi:MaoC family dehydratase [Mycobacterium sp. 1274756.6]|uniref:MaoC family dehydratase n=1 Tax=Mycobacterium sp. 1274756.6 TaxID=1834076 RepID=UPI0009EDE2DD|nr:MaoC family dehydratase [Mycobacterium sp. 1274756.6]